MMYSFSSHRILSIYFGALLFVAGVLCFILTPPSYAESYPECGDAICEGEEIEYCDSDCYGTSCGDGVCAASEFGWCSAEPGCHAQECFDSDPDADPSVRGYVEADGGNRRHDYCYQGNMWQFQCYQESDGTYIYSREYTICENGCYQGVCSDGEPEQTECTDSDGGENYAVKGTAVEGDRTLTDYCRDESMLIEYVCGVGEITGLPQGGCVGVNLAGCGYDCPYGCEDGACNRESEATACTDSDGGKKYFIKGETNYLHGPLGLDTDMCAIRNQGSTELRPVDDCIGGNNCHVIELFCKQIEKDVDFEVQNCPYGCEDGACLDEREEDAPDVSISRLWVEEQSTCDDFVNGGTDCASFDILADVFVDGKRPGSSDDVIVNLHEWIKERNTYMFPFSLTFDSSKKRYDTRETFTNSLLPTDIRYKVEIVVDGDTLYSDTVTLTFSSNNSQNPPPTTGGGDDNNVSCTDSDVSTDEPHGRNKWVKGVIHQKYANGTEQFDTDECRDEEWVIEYYCDDNEGWQEATHCIYGCYDGACSRVRYSDTPANTSSSGFENEVNNTNPFPDVDPMTKEGKAAISLFEKAIIGGFPDGEFKGWRLVNRAEASKFLLNGIKENVGSADQQSRFVDVFNGEWYTPFVIRASELSIIKGDDGKNTFRPADGVNTAELLAMLARAFNLPHRLSHEYNDVSSDKWYNEYAGIAWHYGLFLDRGSSLNPDQKLTRSEVAVSLYTVMEDPYKLDRLQPVDPDPDNNGQEGASKTFELALNALPAPRVIDVATVPSSLKNWSPSFWVTHPMYEEMAFVEQTGDGNVLVHGGQTGKAYDYIDQNKITHRESVVYSTDGSRLAYIARDCSDSSLCKHLVVTDGREGKLYDNIKDIIFSPDGSHVAYVAHANEKQMLVFDGVEGKKYEDVSEILFSHDGNSIAYKAKQGDSLFVVVDGIEGKYYANAWLNTTTFLPNGKLVYEVSTPVDDFKKMRRFFVIGSEEQNRYGQLGRFTFNENGSRIAYRASRTFGGQYMAVVDGVEKPEYVSTYFGPNDSIAYVAYLPGGEGVLFRGKESPANSRVEKVVFSPDGNHVANVTTASDQTRYLMIDGEIIAEYKHFAWSSVFSPQSDVIAYRAEDENGMSVFVNQQRGPVYDFVWEPYFSSDGSTVIYGAYDGEKFLRVEQSVPR
jgi:hypothetical protein